MENALQRALILTILQHAEDFAWRMQDVGLMALRLDDRREFRLHVWAPEDDAEEPAIHDHPYDFTSVVVAGELTNTTYEEDLAGEEFVRFRYRPPAEDQRRSDGIRLSATTTTLRAGKEYRQLAHQLHASRQEPGTVTVIRCTWVADPELTVCLRKGNSWRSGYGRDATTQEVKVITARALERF
jgi:hypothetical protein